MDITYSKSKFLGILRIFNINITKDTTMPITLKAIVAAHVASKSLINFKSEYFLKRAAEIITAICDS